MTLYLAKEALGAYSTAPAKRACCNGPSKNATFHGSSGRPSQAKQGPTGAVCARVHPVCRISYYGVHTVCTALYPKVPSYCTVVLVYH